MSRVPPQLFRPGVSRILWGSAVDEDDPGHVSQHETPWLGGLQARTGVPRGGIDFRVAPLQPPAAPSRKTGRKGPFAHFAELVDRKNCITRLRGLSAAWPTSLFVVSTFPLTSAAATAQRAGKFPAKWQKFGDRHPRTRF